MLNDNLSNSMVIIGHFALKKMILIWGEGYSPLSSPSIGANATIIVDTLC